MGSIELSMLLLELGADINARDKQGLTPAAYAEYQNHFRLFDKFKRMGATVLSQNSIKHIDFVSDFEHQTNVWFESQQRQQEIDSLKETNVNDLANQVDNEIENAHKLYNDFYRNKELIDNLDEISMIEYDFRTGSSEKRGRTFVKYERKIPSRN